MIKKITIEKKKVSDQIRLEELEHNDLKEIIKKHILSKSSSNEGELADLSSYVVRNFDFSNLDLSEIHACDSIFVNCKFTNCDLYGVDFSNSSLVGINFKGSMLGKSEFYEANLSIACFDNTDLNSAVFIRSNLRGATFRNADINHTSFTECDLTDTVFDDKYVDLKVRTKMK